MSKINYLIGDFLIKIKNASIANKKDVKSQYSGFVKDLADLLKKLGYLNEVTKKDEDGKSNIYVTLSYKNKKPVIIDLKLVSRPGIRIYWSSNEIEKYKGPEEVIISTPLGLMSKSEAIKKRVGGEVLVKIL